MYSMHTEEKKTLENVTNKINSLPPNELNYYMMLLLSSLQQISSEIKKQAVIKKLELFIISLDEFYKKKTVENLEKTVISLESLIHTAQTHTYIRKIQKILLNICASMTSIILGFMGGVIGSTTGLFSEWNIIKGAYTGLLIGASLGFKVGSHLPDRLLRNQSVLKITYSLDHLHRISKELETKHLHKEKNTKNIHGQRN